MPPPAASAPEPGSEGARFFAAAPVWSRTGVGESAPSTNDAEQEATSSASYADVRPPVSDQLDTNGPVVTDPFAGDMSTPSSPVSKVSAASPVTQPSPPSPPSPPSSSEAEAEAAPAADVDDEAARLSPDRNGWGLAAFISGALLVSPAAIVLGHVGLRAAAKGRADNRNVSLAGVILGYIGLVLTIGVGWLLWDSTVRPGNIDAKAQQAVSLLGASAAEQAVATGQVPSVSPVPHGYLVGDQSLRVVLRMPHEVTMTGAGPADWCLQIVYEGGHNEAVAYTAAEGMIQGPCPVAG